MVRYESGSPPITHPLLELSAIFWRGTELLEEILAVCETEVCVILSGYYKTRWPQMNLGSLWLHMCHERFALSAVCQMHYLTSLVLQPTLPHHHRIRVGLCWAQLSSQCREILNKCFQCSDNQMKYLWGPQVFRQKDCYAKSEPCYFTKG